MDNEIFNFTENDSNYEILFKTYIYKFVFRWDLTSTFWNGILGTTDNSDGVFHENLGQTGFA